MTKWAELSREARDKYNTKHREYARESRLLKLSLGLCTWSGCHNRIPIGSGCYCAEHKLAHSTNCRERLLRKRKEGRKP